MSNYFPQPSDMAAHRGLMAATEQIAMQMPDVVPAFDRPWLAAAAAGAVVVGALVTRRQVGNIEAMATEDEEIRNQFPGGSDMAESAKGQFRRAKWRSALTGLAMAAAVGGGIANEAGPYTEEQTTLVDSVTVVIEAGADASAGDVQDESKDKEVSRVDAGVNSALRFASRAGEDVKVNFVMAGTHPDYIGSVRGTDGATEVVEASNTYLDKLSNRSEPEMGAALAVGEAKEADYEIILTTTDKVENIDAINAEAKDKTVISAGQPNTNYTYIGQERTASYNTQFGAIKAERARSTGELAEIFDEVADTHVVTKKKVPSKIFEYVRNGGIAALAAFGASGAINMLTYRRRKGDR